MKKTLCVIFVSALLFSLSACNKTDLKDNNSSVTDKVYIEQTYKVETSEQNTTVETLPEVLSAEDKSVKAEIAKYSDTTVDFRNNKQEKIGKKDYYESNFTDEGFSRFRRNYNSSISDGKYLRPFCLITSYYKRVVFIDRSPAGCYNNYRVLWIGLYHLPSNGFAEAPTTASLLKC